MAFSRICSPWSSRVLDEIRSTDTIQCSIYSARYYLVRIRNRFARALLAWSAQVPPHDVSRLFVAQQRPRSPRQNPQNTKAIDNCTCITRLIWTSAFASLYGKQTDAPVACLRLANLGNIHPRPTHASHTFQVRPSPGVSTPRIIERRPASLSTYDPCLGRTGCKVWPLTSVNRDARRSPKNDSVAVHDEEVVPRALSLAPPPPSNVAWQWKRVMPTWYWY